MENDEELNESRSFKSGETVYLYKDPLGKWKISFYECSQNVSIEGFNGMVFEFLEGLPRKWKGLAFDSPDAAANYVHKEIQNGNVPGNFK
jgi:hypothetical protein